MMKVVRIKSDFDVHKYIQPDKIKRILILSDDLDADLIFNNIFSTFPEVFFSIRPLQPIFDDCSSIGSFERTQLLTEQFSCSFKNQSTVFSQVGLSNDPKNHNWPLKECLVNNFCFRKHNRYLCSEELCGRPPSLINPCSKCRPVDVKSASKICKRAEIRVISITRRSCDAGCLKKLLKMTDIKIIDVVCSSCKESLSSCNHRLEKQSNLPDSFSHLTIKFEDMVRHSSIVEQQICQLIKSPLFCLQTQLSEDLKLDRKIRDLSRFDLGG